ncbi:uncharacterized protein LOC112538502 isoform X1 [Tetranychus urticae]|uniref:uncharacterized protein LOC112538502 isoform X1 n=1 Tax=Tetranychus urticae TaxID=32264 RepID=UPI000D647333|nr:uncharacterized protein LOC112538502 isoform X1 [Tetranychus urticae]
MNRLIRLNIKEYKMLMAMTLNHQSSWINRRKSKMNISFYILLLFVVSTCASKLQPKPLGLKETKRFVDSGIDASGIQSSSSLDSTTQLKTKVVPSPIASFIRKTRSLSDPTLRTLVIRRWNEIRRREMEVCFSKHPIFQCKSGQTATKTEPREIDLVCFGKNPIEKLLSEKLLKEVEIHGSTDLDSLDGTGTYDHDSPIKCRS